MHKCEIGWERQTDEGVTIQVFARHVGRQWLFFVRERRYDVWQDLDHPPLEDWMELLDGVRRRIGRRKLRPEEEENVKSSIRSRFPEADLS